MARLLVPNRRLILPSGRRRLLTSPAPCCCGGPRPCVCEDNPGCQSTVVRSFAARKVDIFGTTIVYQFGPNFATCCCKPSRTTRQSIYFESTTFFVGGPCSGRISERIEWQGTGDDTSYTVFGKQWNYDQTTCGLQSVDDLPTVRQPITVPCRPLPFLVPGDDLTFGSLRGIGFMSQTCSAYTGDILSYVPNGSGGYAVRRRVRWSDTLNADTDSCTTPGCKVCCLPDEGCLKADEASCRAFGGTPVDGDDCSVCEEVFGRQRGRCCLPDGSCRDTSQSLCAQLNGVWTGLGTRCADFEPCPPPPTSGCCLPSGQCIEATQAACQSQGGNWNPSLHCASLNCNLAGACCGFGGACQDGVTQADCLSSGGIFRGAGTTCAQVSCTGACCNPVAGGFECVDNSTFQICQAVGGVWNGYGSVCPQAACNGGSGLIQSPIVIPDGALRRGCGTCGNKGLL